MGERSDCKVYLVIADIHRPFEKKNIYQTICKYRALADHLIIAGDSIDCYAVSRFIRSKDIEVKNEMKGHYGALKGWASEFESIDEIPGNHVERIERYISSQLDSGLKFLIDAKILHRYQTGFDIPDDFNETVEHFEPIKNYIAHDKFWFQVGDAVVVHPTSYSKIPMRTGVWTDEWFSVRGIQHRAVIVAHTHHCGSVKYNDHLVVETGACCGPMEYSEESGNIKYRPVDNSIFLLVQHGGVTDFNESRLIHI
jgi:hypothetical protein